MVGFIGVHIGAGNHSEKLQSQYENICKIACKKGVEALKSGKNACDAVTLTTVALEDSPLTNAGIGSSLTWDGQVECDASVMYGDRVGFGAVGAVSKVKNPILLAHSICQAQYDKLPLDRVPPCLLVGSGAEKWAEEKSIELIDPKLLISSKSLNAFKKYKQRAESHSHSQIKKESVTSNLLDTVGAVAVDLDGNVAASCSSGGIILKYPGRVGQAGIFGCGCWAENHSCGRRIGVSVSGCGEDLVKTSLARETAASLYSSENATDAINNSIKTFLQSPFLGKDSQRLCGVIAVDMDAGGGGEFVWSHTTNSIAVGYMSTRDTTPHSCISRLPKNVRPGTSISIEGIPL